MPVQASPYGESTNDNFPRVAVVDSSPAIPERGPVMAESFKKLWQGWKKFAHKLGVIQTYIIITLFYWIIVPFFSLIRFQNLLRLRQPADRSYWIERKTTDNSLARAKQQS
jgi:hypothetical protein